MTALDVGILIVVAAMLAVVGLAWWSGRRRTSYEEYCARHPGVEPTRPWSRGEPQKTADAENVAK